MGDQDMTQHNLRLGGSVVVCPTVGEVYDKLGESLIAAAKEAVDQRGAFHMALSGGSTPKLFYELLGNDPKYRGSIAWSQTHLWIVDERRVPEDDERNNFKMIRAALVDRVYGDPYPANHVHPVPVDDADPGIAYEQTIRREFGDGGVPRLDFVLLGIGADAHTASLFPGTAGLNSTRLIANNEVSPGTQPNVGRVTMTYPLLNAARQVAVLVTGAGKADTLRRIDQQLSESGPDPHQLPITGIKPTDGQLTWYLDAAATGNA
jgi:6-phosphogluconolactonase